MLTIAVWNLKGGTGKSTTTLNLGAALATSKLKVLLIDLDGQRTLSFGLGKDGETPTVLDWLNGKNIEPTAAAGKNLFLIPGDIGMFRFAASKDVFTPSLKRIRPLGFNVCLMDCPPNLGVVAVQAISSSDRVLMPTLCEPAALKGLSEAVELIRGDSPDKPIDVLRCRHRQRLALTREADDLLIEAAADLNYQLLHNAVPDNIQVAEAIAQQKPVLDYAPRSSGSLAYKSLSREVSKLWKVK